MAKGNDIDLEAISMKNENVRKSELTREKQRLLWEVFVMAITADLLQSLVPISQFNKGQAAKIFDRLRSEKELIVLKNNQPSAVILSPEEYARLTEIEEEYFLLIEANKRV